MNSTIDLNKIRSLKALEAMRKTLADFVNFDPAVIKAVYAEEYGWGDEDYDADKEQAADMLERVEKRMKSLGRHLSKVKADKSESQSPSLPEAKESAVPVS